MRESSVEIETIINGGLPVLVEGVIVEPLLRTSGTGNAVADGIEWPGHSYVDVLRVRFLSGHPYHDELEDEDEARIERELMEEFYNI